MKKNYEILTYSVIGVFNTLLHWLVFMMVYWVGFTQGVANLLGFLSAVTFSFFANAKWTFRSKPSISRYLIMTLFMMGVSYSFGYFADYFTISPLVTLLSFSTFSLLLGFLFAKWIVFKD